MKTIAILAPGEARESESLARLMKQEGRAEAVLLVSDDITSETARSLSDAGIETVGTPDSGSLAELLAGRGIDAIIIESRNYPLPEELNDIFRGRIIFAEEGVEACRDCLDSISGNKPEISRGEINLDKREDSASVRTAQTPPPVPPSGKMSVDEEWAERLHINFDPSVATVPPPVPERERSTVNNAPHIPQNTEPMPPTYLIWSVICTLLCCFIPGIVAIIFSSMVSSRYYAGDLEGAKRASRNAEIWIIVSFVLGLISSTIYLPIMLAV